MRVEEVLNPFTQEVFGMDYADLTAEQQAEVLQSYREFVNQPVD